MKPYTSPKLVFERSPNPLDRVLRAGKTAVAVALAIATRNQKETKAQRRINEANDALRDRGHEFTQNWRTRLGDDLNGKGVQLKTTGLPYTIEADLRKKDTIRSRADLNDAYETFMVAHITLPEGHTTHLKVVTKELRYGEAVDGHTADANATSRTTATLVSESGAPITDGWAMYTFTEAAQLDELGVRIMNDIDAAHEVGTLDVTST